ncbi:MAG: sulfatase, partial [Phycisphaeraceae bacterium]
GRVLHALDEAGLAGNTLVIYCSDHGEMAGQHGLWAKKCFYEEAARVPMIARWPGVTPAGATQPTICNLYDIAPTLTEIAQHEPHDFDGRSLMPMLHGTVDPERETLSEVADTGNSHTMRYLGRMIRRGPWKLWQHVRPEGEAFPPVLYHVEDDPHERTNLADAPAHAATRDGLLAALNTDWDPVGLMPGLNQQIRDYKTLLAWGRTVQPTSEDAFVNPGGELEDAIELRSLEQPA